MNLSNLSNNRIIKIKLNEIQTLPELSSAFKIDEDVKNRIKADMLANGFSKGHPIHIFKWENKWVLCDGHTRYTAAKELQIKYIYAQVHEFNTINDALLYSYEEQFNRRNVEDAELFKQFELLKSQNVSIQEMSEKLKKSKRTLFKIQEVFAKASKKQLADIKESKSSFNSVYNSIKKDEEEAEKKRLAEEETRKIENAQNEFISNIDIPESTEIVEEKLRNEMNQKIQEKQRKVESKELELKQRELEMNERLSDKEILLIGIKFALIETAKGNSPFEIINDNRITDTINASNLSFSSEDLELLNS